MNTQAILEKLLTAADNHGEDSGEPDHTVGDLQDMLRLAWEALPPSKQIALLSTDGACNVVELGARGEFEADDLVAELKAIIQQKEDALAEKGIFIESTAYEQPSHFYARVNGLRSRNYLHREDAVAAVYDWHQRLATQGDTQVAAEDEPDEGSPHRMIPIPMDIVERVARCFCEQLLKDLGEETLAQVVQLNQEEGLDSIICHSHDYIDANITMADAFVAAGVCANADDAADEACHSLWNAAWRHAKLMNFGLENTTAQHPRMST